MSQPLPLNAMPVTLGLRGVELATPGMARQNDAFNSRSYYNFTRAMTFPQQITFSGYGNVCANCLPNKYAINIPQAPPTAAIPPAKPPCLTPGRPIAMADSALQPVTTRPPARQNFAAYVGCTDSRLPYMGFV